MTRIMCQCHNIQTGGKAENKGIHFVKCGNCQVKEVLARKMADFLIEVSMECNKPLPDLATLSAQSLSDLQNILDEFSEYGISAEESAKAFRDALSKIQSPSPKAKELLKILGVEAKR